MAYLRWQLHCIPMIFYFNGILESYSMLLLLIASLALTCAAILRSTLFKDSPVDLFYIGTCTILTRPSLLFISFFHSINFHVEPPCRPYDQIISDNSQIHQSLLPYKCECTESQPFYHLRHFSPLFLVFSFLPHDNRRNTANIFIWCPLNFH